MAPKDQPQTIGRYDVVDRLGYGGMGVVYRARDPRIGRAVAIKLLRVRDEGHRDRFLQEAQSAGNLKHRNIVTIYDFGEHDGQPYIVMELIEGITLSEQIRSNLPLSLPRKIELIEELAMGLEYAHNKGIVHRDVKPANIMIDRDGWLKILDFGIARVGDSGMTRAGMMMGTPNYMSPEQVEGRPVDRRSDIFAVGLVAYEVVSYRQAFPGDTLHLVMNAIAHSMPTPLEQLCPGLDPALVTIINKAMQKDPARRYQTLAAMAADTAKARTQLAMTAPAGDHSDTATWPPPPTPESKRTPRGGTNREQLSKRRAELIDAHLRVARQEFEAANYAAAIDECERAILLEPDEPSAWALIESARRALDREEVRKILAEARLCLERGDPDGASALVARALQMDPTSDDIPEVQSAVAALIRRREQESERRALIAAAVARGEAGLASNDLDSVISAASEILSHDPANREAHDLARRALALSQARLAREQRHREAQAFVDQQRRAFAEGRGLEAIEALQGFTPPHELVTAALTDLRAELANLERRAREEDERRRQEQAETDERRRAQQGWVANQTERAKAAAGAGQFLDAIAILENVQRVHADASGLADLLDEARRGQAALEAERRRRQQVADTLDRAAAELAHERFGRAVALVDAALALEPGHVDATRLRQRIEQAIDSQRRQQAIDREADVLVEQARRRFDAGEHAAAIAMLESPAPHPVAAKALEQLKTTFGEIERQRAEQRRQRDNAIRKGLQEAHRAFARHDLDRALAGLDDTARLDPDHPEIAALRAKVIAEVEEVRRREEHERRARATVVEARRRFATGDRVSAIASLEKFDPPHAHVSEALTALRAELAALEQREQQRQEKARRSEEERIRKEVAAQLASAQSCLERRQPEEAVRLLEALRQHVPDGSMPSAMAAEVESLLAAGRLQMQARATAEQEARRRQSKVSSALQAARTTESARSAIAILQEALDLDPTNAECRDLLSDRLATIRAQAAQLIEARQFDLALDALEGLESFDSKEPALAALRMRALAGRSISAPSRPSDALTLIAPLPSETVDLPDFSIPSPPSPEREIAPEVVSPPTGRKWMVGVAAALLLGTAGAGVIWKLVSPAEQSPAIPPRTIQTTSIPVVSVPSSVPPSVLPQPDVILENLVATIRTALQKGDLAGAARSLGTGLSRAPTDPRWGDLSRDIIRAAGVRANDAKRSAERSGGTDRPPYAEGVKHMEEAARLAKSGRVETAVNEYLTAGRLFEQAVKPGQPVERQPPPTLATTSTPTPTPTTTPPTSVATTTPTTAPIVVDRTPTTTPPTVPGPVIVSTIDEPTARQLLGAFTAAYQTFDAARLRRIFPSLTRLGQLTLDSDKKNFSSCDYRFANLRISPGSATTARVDADGVKACKPKIAMPTITTQSHEIFDLNKLADGSWIIARQSTSY